ncbi:MAG: hypothetical protein JNJ57_19655 [Saprospiraceae bacterium]|nr:hypothetical protein [Saprospiraceae bacterium]
MKFQADFVEYWSDNRTETVFFGNEEKELALTLSIAHGSDEHYLEWNDQSNACYNGVKKVELSGETLHIELQPEAAKQLGEKEITVEFDCDETTYKQVCRGLELIFKGKIQIKNTEIQKKEAPKKDYSAIRYLNLESKKLKKLPEHVREMTALETVRLAYNPDLDLQDTFDILGNCRNLRELGFTAGATVPENIGNLTQLETLNIVGLEKPCAFPESFGQLKRLKSLLVMGDSDITLPESFADLASLESLNLRIEGWNLPSRFYQLTKLKTLDFSNCRFSQLSPEFAKMTAVETVIFNGSGERDYAQIMPLIAQLPNLKTLEMNVNPVPKETALCKQIEELIIWAGADRENPLQLPDELFELSQLQTLIMSRNYFDKVPDAIGKLKGLKTLALEEAEFENLPESIGELSNLEFLNLSENPSLKSLPDSLGKLTQLNTLYLEEIPQLNDLPLSLKNLSNLTSIRISNKSSVKNVPDHWVITD